eukprot:8581569-Pyramimonas_sp.AAC.2
MFDRKNHAHRRRFSRTGVSPSRCRRGRSSGPSPWAGPAPGGAGPSQGRGSPRPQRGRPRGPPGCPSASWRWGGAARVPRPWCSPTAAGAAARRCPPGAPPGNENDGRAYGSASRRVVPKPTNGCRYMDTRANENSRKQAAPVGLDTDAVALTAKTLLSRLVTREFVPPTNYLHHI